MRKLSGPRILWVLGASLLSAVLLRLSYPVPGWFPLAWVALAPWFVVLREGSRREALLGSAAMGLLAAGTCLSWQYIVTVPGGVGLSIYVGMYLVLFAWLARLAGRRLRIPFLVAAPVLWVGCEYLRSFLLTGFPWLFIGHTQFPFKAIIQVSDLLGAYAVSFIVVAANAFVAEAALAHWRGEASWRRLAVGGIFVAALVACALGYGAWRLATLEVREGPLVGIVQGNVPQEIKNELTMANVERIFEEHRKLTRELQDLADADKLQLDLAVWPETMVQLALNREDHREVPRFRSDIGDLARSLRCPILVGGHAEFGLQGTVEADVDGTVARVTPDRITMEDGEFYTLPPQAEPEGGRRPTRRILVREGQRVLQGDTLAEYVSVVHNSAYLFRPDAPLGEADRYDKTHLVPFGEYVPLGGLLAFFRQFVPYGKGFSPGPELRLLQAGGLRFGVLICFESVFPEISRGYVVRPDGPGADFLINISNDGWFRGSHELDQHLAICGFRAVENRIGIVRSVNSGISGIIDPAGRVRLILRDDLGRAKLAAGVAVGRVPLRQGTTFYARHGDLFAGGCFFLSAAAVLAALAVALLARLRRPPKRRATA